MVKQMKLRGQVRLNMDSTYTFIGALYDGTTFECAADIHDFEVNDEFEPGRYTVDGWLHVVMEAQQHTRCYLTIPKPSLVHGRQILVNELQLMPRAATLADFRPQRTGGGAAPVGEVVAPAEAQAALAQAVAEEAARPRRPKSASKS